MSGWLPPAVAGKVQLPQPFAGVHGPLPFTHVHYELTGNREGGVIVVLGGISAGRHVTANALDHGEGWWQAQVGIERAIDPCDVAILGIDFLGHDLERGSDVPQVDTRDQARAIAAVLDHLAVQRLTAFVGSSYGGMVALAFASLFAARVDKLVVIGAAHEPHPMATAVRSIQRDIVRLAQAHDCAADGLDIARRLAMTTYRTPEEFAERFSATQRVEDYLAHCGRRYAETYTPERFLCLSQSIDLHHIDPAHVRVPTTLVAIDGDAIAPPWQIAALAREVGKYAAVVRIQSRYGHDAFLKETAAISNILTHIIEPKVHA